jgi:putative addiction module component (TIGR02574 family)
MDPDVSKLLKVALALPAEGRAALAGSLIDSLDETVEPDAEKAWAMEIRRRIADIDEGRVRLVSWAEAREAILAR